MHWPFIGEPHSCSLGNSIFPVGNRFPGEYAYTGCVAKGVFSSSSKLLYRSLATTDLLVGLISEPSAALYSVALGLERDRQYWLRVCFYSAAVSTVSFTILYTVSLLTLAAISIDRLLPLLSGVRYRHIVTVGRTRTFMIWFWISSIVFASFSIWKYEIPFSFRHGIILLCLLISAACYTKIYFVLRQRLHVNHEEKAKAGENLANIARYRKTVFTALWVQLTLVICYLPYSIVIAIVTVNGSSPFLHALWGFSAALVYLNSTLNPVLYCWKIRSFRNAVKDTVKQLCPWRKKTKGKWKNEPQGFCGFQI